MSCPTCGDEVGEMDGREHLWKKHGVMITCPLELLLKRTEA